MLIDDFYADREMMSADESAKILLYRQELHRGGTGQTRSDHSYVDGYSAGSLHNPIGILRIYGGRSCGVK